eukprot:5723626-Ditylum_brightwellii.AAC.1
MKLLEQGGENNTIKKEESPDYFNYGEPTAEGGKEHNGAEAKSIKNVVVPGKEVELNICDAYNFDDSDKEVVSYTQ